MEKYKPIGPRALYHLSEVFHELLVGCGKTYADNLRPFGVESARLTREGGYDQDRRTLTVQLQNLGETNARRMAEVRATLDAQLAQLQQSNAAKLDEMRQTVDEKLQTTLETRLGESFKQVAERLEQVATRQPVFQLWWVVGAVIEGLRGDGLEGAATVKRLLGQAKRLLLSLDSLCHGLYRLLPANRQ